MELKQNVYASNLTGLDVVKNSRGTRDNLSFFTHVKINTEDNSIVEISYTVQAFSGNADSFNYKFTTYKLAVQCYNEMIGKWNPNREVTNIIDKF